MAAVHRCSLKLWRHTFVFKAHLCRQNESKLEMCQTSAWCSDTQTHMHMHTHTEQWLKQMCGCVNMLSNLSLSPLTHHFFPVSVLCSLCVWDGKWIEERDIEGESSSSVENREVMIGGGRLQEQHDQRRRVRDHLAAGRQPHWSQFRSKSIGL